MSQQTLLTVSGLQAWYGAAKILYDVDFSVARGEVVALMGRNGAGKSTTMKSIMGLMDKRRGQLHFMDQDISQRATVNICCSPPLIRPPGRVGISPRLGKSLNSFSGVQCGAGAPLGQ